MRQCWGTVSTGMWRCKSGDCTGLQLLKRQVVPVDDFYLLISELDFWKKKWWRWFEWNTKIETRVTFDFVTWDIVENGQKFEKEEINNIYPRVSKLFKLGFFQ